MLDRPTRCAARSRLRRSHHPSHRGHRATLLLLSEHANASIHVTHEVERATSKRKRVDSGPVLRTFNRALRWNFISPRRTGSTSGVFRAQVGPQLASVVRGQSREPATPVLPADTRPISNSDQHLFKIVPKGLRSFDEHDADFFLELFPDPAIETVCPTASGSGRRKIEQLDPDLTFKVGLIYGPSGCGKSSLVKAGLLPRLAKHVLPVYVEATADETESRLLKGLRKACPELARGLGWSIRWRTCEGAASCHPSGRYCWSSTNLSNGSMPGGVSENTELVAALRHCDGEHVQAIVMVRDDFWMAATRFMRDLEIRLLEGENRRR